MLLVLGILCCHILHLENHHHSEDNSHVHHCLNEVLSSHPIYQHHFPGIQSQDKFIILQTFLRPFPSSARTYIPHYLGWHFNIV